MSERAPVRARAACASCLRRSWLLAQLSGPLDCNCRADGRLFALLALSDEELIAALGGCRRTELRERHERFSVSECGRTATDAEVCRHDSSYPRNLRGRGAPAMLFASGGLRRLTWLCARPIVAIAGTSKATDYGVEMASALARGLAASGVTIAGTLTDGIGRAALEGALQAGDAALAVLQGGIDVAAPARRRALLEEIEADGAAVSELPSGTQPRRWSLAAAERVAATLADATVVVEAADSPLGLRAAGVATALGRPVAAVPGRVTSRASSGSNALLRDGATLVQSAGDVLDLLHLGDRRADVDRRAHDRLAPRLRELLERVGAGVDTPEKLTEGEADAGELLQALSELELLGLLARGHGGRYVPRLAVDGAPVRYGSPRQMEP